MTTIRRRAVEVISKADSRDRDWNAKLERKLRDDD